ncbi:MAG: hypothetical protein AAGA90_02510 [Actinomycetota bacterium]
MREVVCRRGTLWLIAVVAVFALAGCGGDEAETTEPTFTLPRTYEDLDLSTPQAAVEEFISAFVRRDYVTAGLILHRDTQATMEAAFAVDDLRGLVGPNVQAAVLARITVERDGDHVIEAGRAFEIAMEEAMANGGLQVDLASGADGLTLRSSDRFSAVVDGILATNGNDVAFELAPASDGRWRIRSVRLTNGLPSVVPFSGTPSVAPPSRGTEPTGVWRSTLPNADPQELLDTVGSLLDAQDHVSLYLLLDTTAQQAVIDALAGHANPDHALIAPVFDARLDLAGLGIDTADVGRVANDVLTTSGSVEAGEALTFMVEHGELGLDVTMSRDSSGAWRLRRLVPAGEVTAPTPFALPAG